MAGNAIKMQDAALGWLHQPNHAAKHSRCLSSSAAACASAPGLSEDRVRGRTAALDACQRAAPAAQHDADASTSPRTDEGDTTLGYARDFSKFYSIDREVGRGANGIVTAVTHRQTGRVFACKTIPKRPDAAADDAKVAAHLRAVRREIKVLKMLRSCLNVAQLEDVFEDDASVHIVQELCTGGEIAHSVGQRHYSERTAASYMRAVLKTLAQCHAHHILHRDVKPGNFLLVDDSEDARIKAIDFGLAVPYQEGDDLTELDMQGTPWFLAPEALSSRWSPKTDVWAAGVMAFQLLTGRLPFNDKRNPHTPVLSAVLRSIMTETLDFERSYWQGISEEGKDFVRFVLERDPERRPTAAEALQHAWLRGDVRDRRRGAQLSLNVVQRIQRFGRLDYLKRSLLELMAAELANEDAAPGQAYLQEVNYCKLDEKARPVMDSPRACAMELVLRYLRLDDKTVASRETVAAGLQSMGYRLQEGELDRLCSSIGGSADSLSRAAVIASQIDWRYMQRHQKERWLALARRAFDNIDVDRTGRVSVDEMLSALHDKVPGGEVQALYEELSRDAGEVAGGRTRNISFQSFMALLRQPSGDSLDLYDDRQDGTVSTLKSATLNGAASRSVGFLAGLGSSPSLSASPGGGTLAGACALDALREGSVRPSDCSTHRGGRELTTVFEQGQT